MSPVLPFDIIAQIIDIVGDNKDTNLLKELALVSYSFHQICIKHLFATVELHENAPNCVASSKKGFVKLITSRPDVVKYIRKLTYKMGINTDSDDQLLLPVLSSNFLPTISRLNCLSLSHLNWNTLDSLTSAFLHLMHLPTINHIDLSFIRNFPLSSLTPCVNLLRLDICNVRCANPEEDGYPEVVQSELMPKIHEFHTLRSYLLTTKLLHAEMQDGQPAFNFTDLRRLWISFTRFEDEPNIRFLLQNAKLLEELHLSVKFCRNFTLHDILSPSARTLKVLDLTVPIYDVPISLQLAGLCEGLEAIAGHNTLEALFLEVKVDADESEVYVGSIIQNVEKVLVKPGWSALRQVSFKVSITQPFWGATSTNLSEALQSLPDKYLSHLSKIESINFNFSASIARVNLIASWITNLH
jgi:hypothetical protein